MWSEKIKKAGIWGTFEVISGRPQTRIDLTYEI